MSINYKEYEKILTQQAIREAIWQAVKTKTNQTLLTSDKKLITGGVFTDSIWLKDNYTTTENIGTQNAIGKIITEQTPKNYVTAELYNSISANPSQKIEFNSDLAINLGIEEETVYLNKIPIGDAKNILRKLIYEDAKILSIYNKSLNNEIVNDFMKQKLFLNAYDMLLNNATTSSIYTYNDEHTHLSYTLDHTNLTFSINDKSNCTYYPEHIIIKKLKSSQRYTVTSNNDVNSIIQIDGHALSTGNTIEIDFDYEPEYDILIYDLN